MENWLDDARRAAAFLTRLPIPHAHDAEGFLRAMRMFPVVGAAIGLVVGGVLVVLLRLHLPPLAGAALAIGVG
ncbi:UNVERIFIED_CONTAM: adenosylcobinamide-GDP ribazoletransferase, partial [Bacteroidetes bacterium 56_B9]